MPSKKPSPRRRPATPRRPRGRTRPDPQLLQRDRELEAIRRISETLFQCAEVDELIETALRIALDEAGAEAGSVLLADPETKQLVFHYSIGEKPVPRGTTVPWDQGIAGTVFQSGKPAILGNVKKGGRHYAGVDQTTGFVTRDMITLPLKRWKGEPIGVFNVLNKRNGTLGEPDLALLTILSAFTALAIQQARSFEEAKKAEVVDLLGNIGHDLKNLLQPVVSGTWLLQTELDEHFGRLSDPDSSQGKTTQNLCNEVIQMVKTTTERIHERVKEIADCVKGLSAPPQFAPCTVADVVKSVLQTLHMVASEKEITLRTENLETLPSIMADERRLYNAFYNLINNAIPEVPRGGSITVSGYADATPGVICVSVADTGRGMPPEVRDRLFTARAVSTKQSGTGLGTKIVKDVVEAHKGTITVESEVGKGTTFRLRLPLDPSGTARA